MLPLMLIWTFRLVRTFCFSQNSYTQIRSVSLTIGILTAAWHGYRLNYLKVPSEMPIYPVSIIAPTVLLL